MSVFKTTELSSAKKREEEEGEKANLHGLANTKKGS
jgi:hypothetical protein